MNASNLSGNLGWEEPEFGAIHRITEFEGGRGEFGVGSEFEVGTKNHITYFYDSANLPTDHISVQKMRDV
jgi:hypothetical protein